MARSVADAVHLMMAMQGHDKNDGASYKDTTNYVEHLKTDGLKGKRIGVMRELAGYNTELDQVFNRRIEELKAAGAIIVDDLKFPNGRNWGGAMNIPFCCMNSPMACVSILNRVRILSSVHWKTLLLQTRRMPVSP